MTQPQHFVFALVRDFTHMAFASAVEPLRLANLVSGKELYSWSFASENGESATSSNGAVTLTHHGFDAIPKCDYLFVLSGANVKMRSSPKLLALVRRERTKSTRIGALCSGAYVLAQAGLLDGQRAALHWEFHDAFQEEFPDVQLEQSVFVADGKFITASGGSATADLMLHLIERDHGHDVSVLVADQMVYNAVRDGSASQRVSLQARNGMRNKRVVAAVQMMADSIEDPPSPSDIASRVGISTRQLERLFGKHLQKTPKQYFMDMRLERARYLLLQTEASITEVAHACGFVSSGHFSRVYRTSFGILPERQRHKIT
ncbi:GlxA family transcriptional regulator [Ruegeria sp.]|uniref:GlxA family transcriptional regulator n=1 Tax=Ruegeria sp. TaxID=1879320 RepID=UPI00231CA3E9|nr:GlxA family transcriptional regulator [Ruegeria sp.]MDA7965572.1 GlxA family transcriptional regulator [Ruegeria sp.]